MAILCREMYLTREEIKTQYQKSEKRKRQSHKHTANCHYNIFYLSLTIFFLNAIMVNIMLEIINRLIAIKPKPAILLKE